VKNYCKCRQGTKFTWGRRGGEDQNKGRNCAYGRLSGDKGTGLRKKILKKKKHGGPRAKKTKKKNMRENIEGGRGPIDVCFWKKITWILGRGGKQGKISIGPGGKSISVVFWGPIVQHEKFVPQKTKYHGELSWKGWGEEEGGGVS